MKCSPLGRSFTWWIAMTASMIPTSVATAQQYAVVDLGFQAHEYDAIENRVFAINNSVQIVGAGTAVERVGSGAFLWEDGVVTDLGALDDSRPGSWSVAWGINEHGVVVGEALTRSGYGHAFMWQDGNMSDLGTGSDDPTASSFAYAINDAGQVVGFCSGAMGAAIWDDGNMRALLPAGSSSTAEDINAAGEVVGSYTRTVDQERVRQAYLWREGEITELGTLGGLFSEAVAINDQGQVVGTATSAAVDAQGTTISHAFIWQDGVMQGITVAPEARSSAADINNAGQVVGRAYAAPSSGGFAFVYDHSHGLENLNDLVPDTLAWNLYEAVAINDLGQIVALGICSPRSRYFLLTPISEGEDAAMLSESPECVPEEWPSMVGTDGAPTNEEEPADEEPDADLTTGSRPQPPLLDPMRLCGLDAHLAGIVPLFLLTLVRRTRPRLLHDRL